MSEPRAPQSQEAGDVRPLVAMTGKSKLPWFFAGGLGLCAILLFQTLEARRSALTEPTVLAPREEQTAARSLAPDLFIPPEQAAAQLTPMPTTTEAPVSQLSALPNPARPQRTEPPARSYPLTPYPLRPWDQPAQPNTSAAPASASSPPTPPSTSADAGTSGRSVAKRFANPATTVPRGTVMQAVLESALDSTRGGFARAIVTRDIFGFDGTRVLVQRGSRILGQYKSDVASGQSRILIQWQRLTRPDGVIIDLDSPSADPLGRAGVKGSVNTHFFERFGGAILQSTLDIGVELAARSASRGTVVVALPGSIQQATQIAQPQQIQPTVKVKQGTSVSVFVAQDLDFTSVDK